MLKQRFKLSPLIFGHTQAKIDLDLVEMQSTVNSITNWVSEFDTLNDEVSFEHRISAINHNGVRIISVASTPTVMKVNDPDYTIAIPIIGNIKSWVQGQEIEASPNGLGIFYPIGKRHTEAGIKSTLLISISKKRVQNTIDSLLGLGRQHLVNLDSPRLIRLQVGGLDFKKLLLQLCEFINQAKLDSKVIHAIGIDESICKLFLTMLEPMVFLPTENISEIGVDQSKMGMICEYIEANLAMPLNLGTLEKVSGLSARTIQGYFKKRFLCTPSEWIASRRLSKAYQLLSNPTLETKVSQVALECGYSNFSLFAKRYGAIHLELPSKTLERAFNKQ